MDNKRRILIAAALAGALGAGLSATVQADEAEIKCYGVAKAGQNDCASKTSAHACAGQSKKDFDPLDFKLMPKSSCDKAGGKEA